MSHGILIVDDDADIRRLIATTLRDVGGFALLEAANGEEALALAEREAPRLIFLDVDMPGIDGLEACRRLRALDATAGATIVMLTAAADAERESRAAGADMFLTKPFSPLELLRLVSELDRGPSG